jgi:hypothetical protein
MRMAGTTNSVLILVGFACFVIGGCGNCPRRTLSRVDSEARVYSAETNTLDCGGATPLNVRLTLRENGTEASSEVFELTDMPFDVAPKWVSPTTLQVTIECSLNDRESCLPPAHHSWHIRKEHRWRSTTIEYRLGPILSRLAPERLSRQLIE